MINDILENAAKGDSTAQLQAGLAYFHGKDVSQDYKEAVKWLEKADTAGQEDACGWLGVCYFKGLGVTEDHSKAFEYFKKGAAFGKVEAQYYLGTFYMRGIGCPADQDRAVYWLEKAAGAGHKAAAEQLKKTDSSGEISGGVLDSFDNLLPPIDASPVTKIFDGIFNNICFTERKKSLQNFIRYQDILARFGNAALILFAVLGFAVFLVYGIKMNEGRLVIAGGFFGVWALVFHYLSAKISYENRYLLIRETIYLPSEAVIRMFSILPLFLGLTIISIGLGLFITLFNNQLLASLISLGGFTFLGVYVMHASLVFANAKSLLNVTIQKEPLGYAGTTLTSVLKFFFRGTLLHNLAGFGYLMMGTLYTLLILATFMIIGDNASAYHMTAGILAAWGGVLVTAFIFSFTPVGFYFIYLMSVVVLDLCDAIFGIAKDIRQMSIKNEEK